MCKTLAVFFVQQFLRIVKQQQLKPASVFQDVFPKREEEADQAGAQRRCIRYVLSWCCNAPSANQQFDLPLAGHPGFH